MEKVASSDGKVLRCGMGEFVMANDREAKAAAEAMNAAYEGGYRKAQEDIRKAIGAVGPFGF